MTTFINNGPDIPERLLMAHEEGRVVFFCGAGISRPAGLPDFKALVLRLFDNCGISPNEHQKSLIKAGQYDVVIGLLEKEIVGGRESVRNNLKKILTLDNSLHFKINTHRALLDLSKTRNGQIRLVTTNFDRLFEEVIFKEDLKVERFVAPLLPIPKKRWTGIVYLHGLLPANSNDTNLNHIVLSSGDFGLAYLTERWGSQFVSELFKNYIVCFVGYGINDPVMRYMTDAIAADDLLGESYPEMFAFGNYAKNNFEKCLSAWSVKNVTPILYKNFNNHYYLHKTLQTWAKIYKDGSKGKSMFLAHHSNTAPFANSKNDVVAKRILWAFTDELAAKYFAKMNPVPPLEWLEIFAEYQFDNTNLQRFHMMPKVINDENLSYNLINRPASAIYSPNMFIVNNAQIDCKFDSIMKYIAEWLIRHLNNPKLVLWIANKGGYLNQNFVRMVRDKLIKINNFKEDDPELLDIKKSAPDAIPNSYMRNLWNVILIGRLKTYANEYTLYNWLEQFEQDGLTTSLRLKLRELLKPCIRLHNALPLLSNSMNKNMNDSNKKLIYVELTLSTDHIHPFIYDMQKNPKWSGCLHLLIDDFTILLKDALDLMQELGEIDDRHDRSYIYQPSIEEHSQNKNLNEWTALIILNRDAWLSLANINPLEAQRIAQKWFNVQYPLFKRLAFFTCTKNDIIPINESFKWLLSDDRWWFWSVETTRESFRLLEYITPKIDEHMFFELEKAILKGPPQDLYSKDLKSKEIFFSQDRAIWLKLAKLNSMDIQLNNNMKLMFEKLSRRYPKWKITSDKREEFPIWSYEEKEFNQILYTPNDVGKLVKWLQENRSYSFEQDDDWGNRCRKDFPKTAEALSFLAKNDDWIIDRWEEALYAWSEGSLLEDSWSQVAQVLSVAPDKVIKKLQNSLTFWLLEQAKTFHGHVDSFFSLIQRILKMEYKNNKKKHVFNNSLSHPIGRVTQALFYWWYRQLSDSREFPCRLKEIFTKICIEKRDEFIYGRSILAIHLVTLFRFDDHWTKNYILPFFKWDNEIYETKVMWQAYLFSASLYWPLLSYIKESFLETAKYYDQLEEQTEKYAFLLSLIALEPKKVFKTSELRNTIKILPSEGLGIVAQVLVKSLKGSSDQYKEYWKTKILPFLHTIWPKSKKKRNSVISKNFAELCLTTQDLFPEALQELKYWLQPISYPYFLIRTLNEKKLCEKFPSFALRFLSLIIDDSSIIEPKQLLTSLDKIRSYDSALKSDPEFIKLEEFVEKRSR